jgi:hypothetical protein
VAFALGFWGGSNGLEHIMDAAIICTVGCPCRTYAAGERSYSGIAHDGGFGQPGEKELALPPPRNALRCFKGNSIRCDRAHGINLAK